jgi:predicted O-methyltransferase YrrM
LWLCKLGPWCLETHFHVENSIERIDGKWAAVTFPEDWHFSRQCRKLGLKLAATKAVRVDHYGGHRWCNQEAWGWETDAQNGVAPAVVPDNWRFPDDVDGWLTEAEGRALAEVAAGKTVLEIGSYCGRSTICMAQTARAVYAVDTFDGRATPDVRDTFDEFSLNLDRYGVSGRVMVAVGKSADVVPTLGERMTMAFIDGAHDEASVLADAALAASVLTQNSLICFHDYQRIGNESVTAVVDHLRARGAELVRVVDTVAMLRGVGATL